MWVEIVNLLEECILSVVSGLIANEVFNQIRNVPDRRVLRRINSASVLSSATTLGNHAREGFPSWAILDLCDISHTTAKESTLQLQYHLYMHFNMPTQLCDPRVWRDLA